MYTETELKQDFGYDGQRFGSWTGRVVDVAMPSSIRRVGCDIDLTCGGTRRRIKVWTYSEVLANPPEKEKLDRLVVTAVLNGDQPEMTVWYPENDRKLRSMS